MYEQILFLTSNKHKVEEAETILNKYNIQIIATSDKGTEIQSDSLTRVARTCALSAYDRLKRPLFVEDSGLFVDKLNGFPGVYSAPVLDSIGCEGILRLLDQERQRSARFECAICYVDEHGYKDFLGKVMGEIAEGIHAGGGFGYDPIFIPKGHTRTFSQLLDVKSRISHRVMAFEQLGEFLSSSKKHDN
jgi:XTP/dITP diphosphohydrolase